MPYIYESHLGGLFISDEELDFEQCYCEECGDSDNDLGFANTYTEAWDILKEETNTFDASVCEICPHNEDYDYCDNECLSYMHSGGYNYSYVSKFICESFKNNISDKNIYYVLAPKHINCNDMLFINYKSSKINNSPITFVSNPAFSEDYANLILKDLIAINYNYVEKSLTKVGEFIDDDNKYIVYTCLTNEPDADEDGDWKCIAIPGDNGYYGYTNIETILEKAENKKLANYIVKNVFKV